MKILREKETKIVYYAADNISLTKEGMKMEGLMDPSKTTENCELITVQSLPEGWKGNLWTYDKTWVLSEYGLLEFNEKIQNLKRTNILKIDSDTDALYTAVVGNRASEYTLAESEARAFADDFFNTDAPESVRSWAEAKGWTNQQAAENILETASQWRTAQSLIRTQRLLRKEQVRTSLTISDIERAVASWSQFLNSIKNSLGV